MKKIVSLFIISLVLVSCALESEYSLPKDTKKDRKLFGVWHPNNAKGSLIFKANKNKTFMVIMINDEGKTDTLSTKSFVSPIKNYKIINLVGESDGKTVNAFYGYRVSKNSFNFRDVKKIKQKFTSKDDLLNYFENNIDKKDFFDEWNEGFHK